MTQLHALGLTLAIEGAVGALLFVITLGMNVMAHKIMRRYREVYE